MEGQTTKQRLRLIDAFVNLMAKFSPSIEHGQMGEFGELVKVVTIEIITSFNNQS